MSVPFTYLIGWSSTNKFYYGVRWAKASDPNELWTKYKTSSKYVKRYLLEYGDPDIIQIRKKFNTAKEARIFEEKVLTKLNKLDPFGPNSKWLNRTTNKSIYNEHQYIRTPKIRRQLSISAKNRPVTDETRLKLSVSHTGKTHSTETKRKIGEGNKGKIISKESIAKGIASRAGQIPYWLGKHRAIETKEKLSEYRLGKTYRELYGDVTTAILKEKRQRQMSKDWIITHPSGIIEQISNLTGFSEEHGLNYARMLDIANGRQKTHRGYKCSRVK
jgi:hypothetical protein